MILPPPTYYEDEPEPVKPQIISADERYYRYVQWWANRPTWKCLVCGAVNGEGCESCNYCRFKKRYTPRPANIIVTEFEG